MSDDLPAKQLHVMLHAVTAAEMAAAQRDRQYQRDSHAHSDSRTHSDSHAPSGLGNSSDPTRWAGRAVELPRFAETRAFKPFTVTFEQAAAELENLPGLYLEPDGSFLWVGEMAAPAGGEHPPAELRRWQLDGQFHEAAGRVLQVELKGDCPAASFERLLAALGALEHPVLAELVQEARYVDAREWFGLGDR